MAGATEDSEELEIPFNGSTYTIKAGKLQIVNTLLSTYTIAVAKNAELHKVQSQLRSLTCGGEGGGAGSPHRSRWG